MTSNLDITELGKDEYRSYLPLKGLSKAEPLSTRYSGRARCLYAAWRLVAIGLSIASRSLVGQHRVSFVLLVLAAGSCQLHGNRTTLFRMQLRLQLFQVHSFDLS